MKTHYLPALLRPYSYANGLRVLFGDQALFCRAGPFAAVGGYDESVPIMEDADLCLKLHAAGPGATASARGVDATPGRQQRRFARPRGVLVQLSRSVATDGRRFEVWGNARATAIHVVIGLTWLFGASEAQMRRIYNALYGDIRAGGVRLTAEGKVA